MIKIVDIALGYLAERVFAGPFASHFITFWKKVINNNTCIMGFLLIIIICLRLKSQLSLTNIINAFCVSRGVHVCTCLSVCRGMCVYAQGLIVFPHVLTCVRRGFLANEPQVSIALYLFSSGI